MLDRPCQLAASRRLVILRLGHAVRTVVARQTGAFAIALALAGRFAAWRVEPRCEPQDPSVSDALALFDLRAKVGRYCLGARRATCFGASRRARPNVRNRPSRFQPAETPAMVGERLEAVVQALRFRQRRERLECGVLDLPNPFAGDAEGSADLI